MKNASYNFWIYNLHICHLIYNGAKYRVNGLLTNFNNNKHGDNMSNGIDPAAAFLIGYNLIGSHHAELEANAAKIEIANLKRELTPKPTTLKAAASTNNYAKILYEKDEKIADLTHQISHIKSEENAKIGALTNQVSETRELAHAWEERAITVESSRDAWKNVIIDLLTEDKVVIPKSEVNSRYLKYYDPLVEKNMTAMKAKRQSL